MKYKILSIVFVTCSTFKIFGQDEIKFYLTSQWKLTKSEKAKYYQTAEYDLERLRLNGIVTNYYLSDSTQMRGHYSQGKKNGSFEFYFENGKLESKGLYNKDVRVGTWEYYYPNGHLMQRLKFFDNDDSRRNESNIMVGEYYNTDGKQLIKNGNGKWNNECLITDSTYLKYLQIVEGEFDDSLKHGTWKVKTKNPNKEKFNKGIFIEGLYYIPEDKSYGTVRSEFISIWPDKYGSRFKNIEDFLLDDEVFPDSLRALDSELLIEKITGVKYSIKNREGGYAYGGHSLMEFISTNIKYPKEARQLGIQGIVIIQVTIDTTGNAKVVKVIKGVNKYLDEEAIRVIKLIKEWLPPLHNGQPYEKTIGIPVVFKLG